VPQKLKSLFNFIVIQMFFNLLVSLSTINFTAVLYLNISGLSSVFLRTALVDSATGVPQNME
jgi:hypothetical protein